MPLSLRREIKDPRARIRPDASSSEASLGAKKSTASFRPVRRLHSQLTSTA